MTEDEKEAIKGFIDSMHPVSSDQWKERALVAEKLLNDLKNTINIGKGIQCCVSNMHDNVAKLVFRWNESEALRTQLSEIDRKLNEVTYVTGKNPVDKIDNLIYIHRNTANDYTKASKELSEYKKYFLNLSEEFVRKSL